MPIRIVVHSDPSFVEAVYSGTLSAGEVEPAAREIEAAARKSDTHLLLADCSALESGYPVFALYEVADWLAREPDGPLHREALVLPRHRKAAEAARFWETVCHNRGLNVRIFEDRDGALSWIVETPEASE